jgi:putative ABC transport system substrate-binding protein
MRRRDFIKVLAGSAATAWPFAAHAQQVERARNIGVLLGVATDDPQGLAMTNALSQALQQLGWVDGRNAKIHYRGEYPERRKTGRPTGAGPGQV